jgi:hypothetical protein
MPDTRAHAVKIFVLVVRDTHTRMIGSRTRTREFRIRTCTRTRETAYLPSSD